MDWCKEFLKTIKSNSIEINNERSLQLEMTIFFRNKIQDPNWKVHIEKNIKQLNLKKDSDKNNIEFVKRDIDIIFFNDKIKKRKAVELKFPLKKNGKVPENMYSFCQDIKFLEQLKQNPLNDYEFNECIFLAITDNNLFWEGNKKTGIYKKFREEEKLYGIIKKPTKSKKIKKLPKKCYLDNTYKIEWTKIEWPQLGLEFRYLLIPIKI